MVLVALVVAAGCGDDDDDADPEADQQRIEAALLTADDLPDGFESVTPDPDADDSANEACTESIVGLSEDDIDAATVAEVGPVQFEADEARVRAEITAFESDEVPSQILDAVLEDEYLACLQEEVAADLPADVDLDGVEAVDLGDVDADQSGSIAVSFNSGGTPVITQVHAARIGRYGVSLEATTVEGAALPDDFIVTALETMIQRLEDG
jgi:hypothetical protein